MRNTRRNTRYLVWKRKDVAGGKNKLDNKYNVDHDIMIILNTPL